MEAAYGGVTDYTAVFLKQERVGGRLLDEETVMLKFKKPFNVYMKWLEGPHEGREALYAGERYDGKVVGHEGGFFGFITLNMDPEGKIAMRGNRHPITDLGLGRLIEIVLENVRRGTGQGEASFEYRGEAEVFGRPAHEIAAEFPADESKGYYAKSMEIWVDTGRGLPVKIRIYGFEGELVESYAYKYLRINPGLSDAEFDEDYEGYDF